MMRTILENRKNKYIAIIILILTMGILVKCYKFGVIMDQTQCDEMGSGYDAWCLLNYGVDRYGNSWPVYFINYGGGQSALYTYVCVLAIKVLGYSRFAIRLPALLFSALAGVFGVLLTGELIPAEKDEQRWSAQVLMAFLYAVSPYTYMASRFALDCNLMFGCGMVFLYFLVKAFNKKSSILYFLSGALAGLTLYTYAMAYIVLPVMLLMSIAYMIRQKRISVSNVVIFVIPLTILAIPLILVQYVNVFDLEPMRLGIFTITKIRSYRAGEFSFDNFFLGIYQGFKSVLWYDGIDYNTNKFFFTFYPMSLPFFFYGLYVLIRRSYHAVKAKSIETEPFMLFWLIGEILTAGLMTEPNTNRMNGMIISVMYLTVIGMIEILNKISEQRRNVFKIAVYASYVLYFAMFLYAYFTFIGFQRTTTSSMCPEAVAYIKNNDALRDKMVATNIPPMFYAASALPSPDMIDYYGNYKDDEHYTCYTNYGYDSLRDYLFEKGGIDKVYLIYNPDDDDKLLFEELGATQKQFGYSIYLYYWE